MVQPTQYQTKFKVSTEVQGDGKLKGFTQSLREIAQTGQQSAKSLKEIASAAGGLSGSLDGIRRSSMSSTRALQNDIRKVRDEIREMAKEARGASQAFAGIGGGAGGGAFGGVAFSLGDVKGKALAAALAIREVVQSLRAVAEVRAKVDQLAAGLDVVNKGDLAKSASDMKFLRDTVDRLGLSFSQTADLFVKVNAAAAQTTLTTTQTRDIFESFAGAVGRLNLSADSSNRIFFALQQIISKGTVSSEELKNQLGEKIPGVMAIAARAFDGGKGDVEAFNKALADGKVMSEDFLPKLAAELRGAFNVDNTTRIDTAAASLNRFDSAIDNLQRTFAEGPIGDLVVSLFEGATNSIRQAADAVKMFNDAITDARNFDFKGLGDLLKASLSKGLVFSFGDSVTISGLEAEIAKDLELQAKWVAKGNELTQKSIDYVGRKQQKLAELKQAEADRFAKNRGFTAEEGANDEYWRNQRESWMQEQAKSEKAAAKLKEESDKKAKEAAERLNKQRSVAIDQLDEYVIQLGRELDKGESLSKVDKLRIDMLKLYNGILPQSIKLQLELAEARQGELNFLEDYDKALKKYEDQLKSEQDAIDKNIDSIRDQTEQLRTQNLEYGLSKSEIEELTIAELERKAASDSMSDAALRNVFAEIDARRQLVDAIRENESLEAAKKLSEEFDKAADDVKKSLTDALVEGTLNAGDFIKKYFKSFAIRILVNPILDAGSAAIKQLLLGGGGSGSGILSSLFGNGASTAVGDFAKKAFADPVSAIKDAAGLISKVPSLLSGGIAGLETSIYNSFARAGSSVGITGTNNIALSNAGVIGSSVGIAYGGYQLGRGISGGFSLNGGTGNSTVNTGALIGGILGAAGGPLGIAIGSAIGSILGGTVNRLFGRKTVLGGSGVEGTFSQGGFAGSTFQDVTQKGGLFRSDKSFTQFGQLSPDASNAIRDYLLSMNKSLIASSRVIRADAEQALKDFVVSGKFYGSLQSILDGVGNQLIRVVLPTIDQFTREGEKLAETLGRVVQTVAAANQASALLGQGAVFSAKNIESAINLIESSGTDLLGQIQAYVSAFVPATKQAERQLELFTEAVRQAGLTGVVSANTTREQFVRLVEGIDLTSDAGQRELQVLLALAPQLDAIIQQRQRERDALGQARVQVQSYIDLLTGVAPSALQQIGSQIVAVTSRLANTTDAQARLALEAQLGDLIFQRYNAELEMIGKVLQSVQEVFSLIENEKSAVQSARNSISGTGPQVFTASQIRNGILDAGRLGALPSSAGISGANERVAQLQSQVQSQQAITSEALRQQSEAQDALTGQVNLAKRAVQTFNSNNRSGSAFTSNSAGRQTVATFDEQLMRAVVDYAAITYNVGDEASVVALRNQINSQIREELGGMTIRDALFGANGRIGQAQGAAALADASATSSQARELELTLQLEQAELARIAAQEEFVASLADYVADASKAVDKLGRLREETVRFYEQQAALANLMRGQADSLRQTVQGIRFADLNPLQQLQQLQGEFALAFANASVSSGSALAGFGGDVNALIGPILEKAASVYASGPEFQRIKELVLSQAETVASRLESLSPQNYQQDSLALLDTIDSTLDLIQENTKSAERLIVDAIDRSKDATLQGLRGVIAAITGESIPAFRRGGDHMGGPRLVGGGGAELEVTGPSRIYSNRQLGQMIMGAPGSEEVVTELKAMREEMREAGQINLKVVTTDGKVIVDKTLREIKERSRKGELVVYTDGVSK